MNEHSSSIFLELTLRHLINLIQLYTGLRNADEENISTSVSNIITRRRGVQETSPQNLIIGIARDHLIFGAGARLRIFFFVVFQNITLPRNKLKGPNPLFNSSFCLPYDSELKASKDVVEKVFNLSTYTWSHRVCRKGIYIYWRLGFIDPDT